MTAVQEKWQGDLLGGTALEISPCRGTNKRRRDGSQQGSEDGCYLGGQVYLLWQAYIWQRVLHLGNG